MSTKQERVGDDDHVLGSEYLMPMRTGLYPSSLCVQDDGGSRMREGEDQRATMFVWQQWQLFEGSEP